MTDSFWNFDGTFRYIRRNQFPTYSLFYCEEKVKKILTLSLRKKKFALLDRLHYTRYNIIFPYNIRNL